MTKVGTINFKVALKENFRGCIFRKTDWLLTKHGPLKALYTVIIYISDCDVATKWVPVILW